jgi:hypothetical protein
MPDCHPAGGTRIVGSVERQGLQPGGAEIGVGAKFLDQQVGRSPNVEVGNHPVANHQITGIMVLDLSLDETAALAQLLRRTINDDRYPLSPRLVPLKAILAKHIKS